MSLCIWEIRKLGPTEIEGVCEGAQLGGTELELKSKGAALR